MGMTKDMSVLLSVQKSCTEFPGDIQQCTACSMRKEVQSSFKGWVRIAVRDTAKISGHRAGQVDSTTKKVYVGVTGQIRCEQGIGAMWY